MMPPLRSFDDLDGKERGQKKTDDLRAMTTLGPRTLHVNVLLCNCKQSITSLSLLIGTIVVILEKYWYGNCEVMLVYQPKGISLTSMYGPY